MSKPIYHSYSFGPASRTLTPLQLHLKRGGKIYKSSYRKNYNYNVRSSKRYPRGRWSRRRNYVVYKRRVRCKPLNKCNKKNIKRLIRYELNKNLEVKYKTYQIGETDMVHGAQSDATALQVFSLARLVGSSPQIPRIVSTETADVNGKRKGKNINLVKLQIRIELNSSEELERCKFFLYVLKTKGKNKPDHTKLQPSDFLDNMTIWRSQNMRDECLSTLYKSSVVIKTPTMENNATTGNSFRMPRQRRKVINLNLKNLNVEANSDGSDQNHNLHFIIFPEYQGAPGVVGPKKPYFNARMFLWYRDG